MMEKYERPPSELTPTQKDPIMETPASPAWHEDVLKEREEALASGESKFSDWEEAKKRIRKNVSCR
jgi:hypothetical protein